MAPIAPKVCDNGCTNVWPYGLEEAVGGVAACGVVHRILPAPFLGFARSRLKPTKVIKVFTSPILTKWQHSKAECCSGSPSKWVEQCFSVFHSRCAAFWAPPHCQAFWCGFLRSGWFALLCPGDQHFWLHVLGGKIPAESWWQSYSAKQGSWSPQLHLSGMLGRHVVGTAARSVSNNPTCVVCAHRRSTCSALDMWPLSIGSHAHGCHWMGAPKPSIVFFGIARPVCTVNAPGQAVFTQSVKLPLSCRQFRFR